MFRHTSELPAPLVGSDHQNFISPERLKKMNLHEAKRQEAPIQRGHYLLAEATKAGRIDEMTKIVSSGEYSLDELVYITQTMPPAIKQFGKLIGIKVKAKPSAAGRQATGKSRNFSSKQRRYLFILSGGVCSICGQAVDQKLHADHVHPFSKGGATTLSNGQALCASCNLAKGVN